MSFSCITNKIPCIESFPKNRHRFFRLSDKWYVKQMKLFNFINCRASWMPGKLHGSLHPPPNQAYQEIKAFTEMVDEFGTKNVAQNTNYLRKIISILYIYIFVQNKIIQVMTKCYYEDPTFKLCRGSGVPLLNFEVGPGVPFLNFEGGQGCGS